MVESNSRPDLTTTEGVQRYLSPTPFASSKVTLLEGGISNFTYRIELQEPYSVARPKPGLIHTMVLKHAEPHVRTSTFPFAVERQDYEVLAFEQLSELLTYPPVPIVTLPVLYHEDRENRVLIISDCGKQSYNLKSLLQTAPPGVDLSRTIGHSLGTFLARLHNATLTSDSSPHSPGVKLKAAFASNKEGRRISAFVTYGRLVETLAPRNSRSADPVLVTPPLDISRAQLALVACVAEEMKEWIKTSDLVLTMGDFWPGNVMVTLDPDWVSDYGVHVTVVDWELAKPGLPGLDIGQFLAEMSQLRTFHPSSKASVDAIVSAFTRAYRDETLGSGTELNLKEVMHVAATHVGAHLIAFTPRVSWGGMELTRQVVREGVEHILRVVHNDEEWIRTSVVGGLEWDGDF